jgi:hypothetical protein
MTRMKPLFSPRNSAAWAALLRRSALAGIVPVLAACGGGDNDGSGTAAPAPAPSPAPAPAEAPPAPAPAPAPSDAVKVTLDIQAPATNTPGWVYWRADNAATSRAGMTRQDAQCSATGPGNKTCSFSVPKGQTVTIVANDNQAQVGFGSTPFNARSADPRGSRSQFNAFSGPCSEPERGVCVFTATDDQTIGVQYTPLQWTRINFVGDVNWRFTIRRRPNLNIASDLQTEPELVVVTPQTPSVATCVTSNVPVPCYDIISGDNARIIFEALPPLGPTPTGALGPLAFVGYDDPACGSDTGCTQVDSTGESSITMKWQYYWCTQPSPVVGPPFVSNSGGWNYGPDANCAVVTP